MRLRLVIHGVIVSGDFRPGKTDKIHGSPTNHSTLFQTRTSWRRTQTHPPQYLGAPLPGQEYKRLFQGSTKGIFKMLEKIKKA